MHASWPSRRSGSAGAVGRRACMRAPAPGIGASVALAALDLALRAAVVGILACLDGVGAFPQLAGPWPVTGTAIALAFGVHRGAAGALPGATSRRAAIGMALDAAIWVAIAVTAAPHAVSQRELVALVATTALAHATAFAGCAALLRRLRARPVPRRVVVLGAPVQAALVRRRIAALLAHRVEIVAMGTVSGVRAPALVPDLGAAEIVLARGPRDRAPEAQLRDAAACGLPVRDAALFLAEEAGYVETALVAARSPIIRPSRIRSPVPKRICDLGAAAILLVLAAPLLALAAIAIRLEGPGPVFHRQRRVGLGGAPFTLLKLRTMRVDAEAGGPRFAARDDPRVTRVGRFLRRVRLDEVPQAIHVLSGRMSMVGPRPERPVFAARYDAALPLYARRHDVLPGITGWAQVNRPYAASLGDAREKLAYDLYYVAHGGMLLDALILARTIPVVVRGAGAR